MSLPYAAFANIERDANLIFNWAERNFPEHFGRTPANTQTTMSEGRFWYYRHYPSTGNYMGINDLRNGYVLGDEFGGLHRVDTVENLLRRVNQENSRSISVMAVTTFASLFNKNNATASARSIDKVLAYTRKSARLITGQQQACAQGGYYTDAIDDANNNGQFDLHETYSITYVECMDANGFYQQGTTHLVIREATNTKSVIDMTFESYISGYTADDISGINGVIRLTTENIGSFSNVSMDAREFVVATNSEVSYWQSLVLNGSVNNADGSSEISIDAVGAVGTEALKTGFSVTTNSPFLYTANAQTPYRGSMTVVIAEDDIRARATLTVLSANSVRFLFDNNDDGTIEEDLTTTWDQL